MTLPTNVVPNIPATVNPSQNLTLTWSGSTGFSVVSIIGYNGVAVTPSLNSYVEFICNANASAPSSSGFTRALLETKVPAMADAKLVPVVAKRDATLDPKDSEVQEILGKAYWLNGDPHSAAQAVDQPPALFEPHDSGSPRAGGRCWLNTATRRESP